MRTSTLCIRVAILAVAAAIVAPICTLAQTFAAGTGTDPVIPVRVTEAPAKVVVPGHHKHTDESLLYGRVRDGVYTVDGMVAKVQLNYDVNGVHFLYLFVPGLGTAVISPLADKDAPKTEAKLQDNVLSFQTGEHHFKLTGIALVSDKGSAPEHLYVKLDSSAWQLGRHPMIGYGNLAEMPYQWPGALAAAAPARTEESYLVPPVPPSLLPSQKNVVPSHAAAVNPAALSSTATK